MIDATASVLVFRARALGAVVPTTGSTTLSATSTGYARAAGSFVTDGFAIGMEILASGFTAPENNGRGIIKFVSATVMTVTKYAVGTVSSTDDTQTIAASTATSAEASASGRTVSASIPILRGWTNTGIAPNPIAPYITEQFVPGTSGMLSGPYSGGDLEETGLYILTLYGLPKTGLSALLKIADAILTRFTPGTTVTAGSNAIRVRGDVGPKAGQALPTGDGWEAITITVPWRVYTTNAIAA